MKRYRFRLEQVRRVRQVQEDLAAAALGAARQEEAAAAAALDRRHRAVATRPRVAGAHDGALLQAQRLVWDAELRALSAASSALVSAGAHVAEQRDLWLAASRRVRALELLDERRREEHRVEADRAEASRVDDLVAARFGLNHLEASE